MQKLSMGNRKMKSSFDLMWNYPLLLVWSLNSLLRAKRIRIYEIKYTATYCHVPSPSPTAEVKKSPILPSQQIETQYKAEVDSINNSMKIAF